MSKNEDKLRNCLSCNKSLKRLQRYYRDGGYFCNKRCYKGHLAKKQKEQEASS